MWIWLVFLVYILMSSIGLFLIKTGANGTSFALQNGLLSLQISPRLILGFLVYVLSFLLSIFVISRMKLSLFYPIGSGTILVISCLLGYFFLKEQIGVPQMIGIVLILGGVIAMNING